MFDRKNYFYPDLPQGYQISQYKQPIVGEGEVEVDVDGETLQVGIERLHLEQDAGKSIHDQHPEYTYVDLNRSGVALMEIVSKPDLRSAKQAQAYVSKLRTILRYLGTSDADMEKGNLRADVNVSVRKPGDEARHPLRDQERQLDPLHRPGDRGRGAPPDRHHRGRRHDRAGDAAVRSRQGRDALDALQGGGARLPLLPRSRPAAARTDHGVRRRARRSDLPELPDEKKRRFMRDFGLSDYDADVLVAERESADYFEAVAKGTRRQDRGQLGDQRAVRAPQQGGARDRGTRPCRPQQLGAIVDLIASGTISGKIAKDLFEIVWTEGGDPAEIVEKRGLKQVTDTGAIEKAVDAIIAANPDKVEQVKAKPTMLGWFVGQVMKASGGKANPQAVNELLRKKLGLA